MCYLCICDKFNFWTIISYLRRCIRAVLATPGPVNTHQDILHSAPGFSGQQDVGVYCREKLEQDGVVVLGQHLGVPDLDDVDDDHRTLHSYLLLRALLLEDPLLLLLLRVHQGQGGHGQVEGGEGLGQGRGQYVEVPWTVKCILGVLANGWYLKPAWL